MNLLDLEVEYIDENSEDAALVEEKHVTSGPGLNFFLRLQVSPAALADVQDSPAGCNTGQHRSAQQPWLTYRIARLAVIQDNTGQPSSPD